MMGKEVMIVDKLPQAAEKSALDTGGDRLHYIVEPDFLCYRHLYDHTFVICFQVKYRLLFNIPMDMLCCSPYKLDAFCINAYSH